MPKTFDGRSLNSTLNAHLKFSERRSGNTTRQVDHAINSLFKGDIVIVQDHHKTGKCNLSNKVLFQKVLNRLNNEHDIVIPSDQKYIEINKINLSLYLMPELVGKKLDDYKDLINAEVIKLKSEN